MLQSLWPLRFSTFSQKLKSEITDYKNNLQKLPKKPCNC